MRVIVLGASAGGGLPQWNCGCPNCQAAREGRIPARTQSSLAISANGRDWAVLNASPDIRAQLAANRALHPTGLRESPLKAVLLTNGDIDHIAGLLTLREKTGFALYATGEIARILDGDSVFGVLDPALVTRHPILIGRAMTPVPGLTVTPFTVPGKVPLFQEAGEVETELVSENTIGLELSSDTATALYVPGCARIDADLIERAEQADLLLFDGTVWRNDEMARTGTGQKTGLRMGHLPMAGEGGSMARFAELDRPRRVFVHINNTNPVLDPASPERSEAETAGWTIAEDGMEFTL
ncbi:MAG: pyrroloquinoline quinone biosynthesis protein PqqB [Pseudomonadota bacterium]